MLSLQSDKKTPSSAKAEPWGSLFQLNRPSVSDDLTHAIFSVSIPPESSFLGNSNLLFLNNISFCPGHCRNPFFDIFIIFVIKNIPFHWKFCFLNYGEIWYDAECPHHIRWYHNTERRQNHDGSWRIPRTPRQTFYLSLCLSRRQRHPLIFPHILVPRRHACLLSQHNIIRYTPIPMKTRVSTKIRPLQHLFSWKCIPCGIPECQMITESDTFRQLFDGGSLIYDNV